MALIYNEEMKKYKKKNPKLSHYEAVSKFKLVWKEMKDKEFEVVLKEEEKKVIEKETIVEPVVIKPEINEHVLSLYSRFYGKKHRGASNEEIRSNYLAQKDLIDFYVLKINGRTSFKLPVKAEFLDKYISLGLTPQPMSCVDCMNKMVSLYKKKIKL